MQRESLINQVKTYLSKKFENLDPNSEYKGKLVRSYWWANPAGAGLEYLAKHCEELDKVLPQTPIEFKLVEMQDKVDGPEHVYAVFETYVPLSISEDDIKMKVFIRYPLGYPYNVDANENSIKVFPVSIMIDGEVISPDNQFHLSDNEGEDYHRWEDGRLCLFDPRENEYYGIETPITQIYLWSCAWFVAYWNKIENGKWIGKEAFNYIDQDMSRSNNQVPTSDVEFN